MTTPEFAIAGTAGGLAILITTTVVKKLRSEWTAEGRAQALHELLLEVEARHKQVLEVLPMIEPPYKGEEVFANVEKTTKLLRAEGTRTSSILGEVSRSGVYRWSPLYKKKEISEVVKRLQRVDHETWRSSTRAAELLPVPEYKEVDTGDNSGADTGGNSGVDTSGNRGVDTGTGGSATYTVETEEEVTTLEVSFGIHPIENSTLSDGSNTPKYGEDPSVPQGGTCV